MVWLQPNANQLPPDCNQLRPDCNIDRPDVVKLRDDSGCDPRKKSVVGKGWKNET